jgi:putative hydrolase of the HAD superfamily
MQDPTTMQAVVFDLDDTLYPERDYVRSGYAAVAEHLRRRFGRNELFEDWLWARFCRHTAAGAFDALNQRFALGLQGVEIDELVQVYRQHVPSIRPYPGVADMLSVLHARYQLGLLTDGYMPAQRLKLDALKLGRFFDMLVFTEEMGRDSWKPAADGFERIAESLQTPHRVCCYVGDNPAKDFVAPNRLGWRTVQMFHPGQTHAQKPPAEGGQPQYIARLTRDLLRILREPVSPS